MKFGTVNAKLQIYAHSCMTFSIPSDQPKHNCTLNMELLHSLFDFLFGTTSSTEEITAIKNSMEILKRKLRYLK